MEAAATKAGQDPSPIDRDRPISVQGSPDENGLATRAGDIHEIELPRDGGDRMDQTGSSTGVA